MFCKVKADVCAGTSCSSLSLLSSCSLYLLSPLPYFVPPPLFCALIGRQKINSPSGICHRSLRDKSLMAWLKVITLLEFFQLMVKIDSLPSAAPRVSAQTVFTCGTNDMKLGVHTLGERKQLKYSWQNISGKSGVWCNIYTQTRSRTRKWPKVSQVILESFLSPYQILSKWVHIHLVVLVAIMLIDPDHFLLCPHSCSKHHHHHHQIADSFGLLVHCGRRCQCMSILI